MVLARLRRCAWVLILVLLTGVSLLVLASAAPGRSMGHGARATVTHVHADGTVHSHAAPGKPRAAGVGLTGSSERPSHCPCCLTDATCALSCFGVAVMPTFADWTPWPMNTSWLFAAAELPSGVAPSGDLDPPRPVSVR